MREWQDEEEESVDLKILKIKVCLRLLLSLKSYWFDYNTALLMQFFVEKLLIHRFICFVFDNIKNLGNLCFWVFFWIINGDFLDRQKY